MTGPQQPRQRRVVAPIVDIQVRGRDGLEEWMLSHGLKFDHIDKVERLVVRPNLDYALAVFPWSEDCGQLYVRLPLSEFEIVRIDYDAPLVRNVIGTMSPATDTIWREGLKVPCDLCGARTGDWCVTRYGLPVLRGNMPHSSRVTASRHRSA